LALEAVRALVVPVSVMAPAVERVQARALVKARALGLPKPLE
jgi:hypothetical protein